MEPDMALSKNTRAFSSPSPAVLDGAFLVPVRNFFFRNTALIRCGLPARA